MLMSKNVNNDVSKDSPIAGVDGKLMRGRTAHRSNAFSRYEKAKTEQMNKVSSILGLRLHGAN